MQSSSTRRPSRLSDRIKKAKNASSLFRTPTSNSTTASLTMGKIIRKEIVDPSIRATASRSFSVSHLQRQAFLKEQVKKKTKPHLAQPSSLANHPSTVKLVESPVTKSQKVSSQSSIHEKNQATSRRMQYLQSLRNKTNSKKNTHGIWTANVHSIISDPCDNYNDSQTVVDKKERQESAINEESRKPVSMRRTKSISFAEEREPANRPDEKSFHYEEGSFRRDKAEDDLSANPRSQYEVSLGRHSTMHVALQSNRSLNTDTVAMILAMEREARKDINDDSLSSTKALKQSLRKSENSLFAKMKRIRISSSAHSEITSSTPYADESIHLEPQLQPHHSTTSRVRESLGESCQMQRGDTSSSHREKAKAIIAKRSSKGFYPATASSSNITDSIDLHQSSMPRQYPVGLDQQYVTDRIVEPLYPQMQYNTSYVPSDHHYGSMSQIDLQCAYGYARTGEAPLGLIPETSTYQRNSIKNICQGQFHNEPHVSESVATPTIRNHTQSTAVTSIISAQNSEQFNIHTVKRLESNQSQSKHASSIQAETNQHVSYAMNDFDQPLKSNHPAQNEYAFSIHAGTDQEIVHARYDADQPFESNQAQSKHDSSIQAETDQEIAHAMFDADQPFESNQAQSKHISSIQADQEIAHARYDADQPLESNPAQSKHDSSIQAETNQEIAHAMFDADQPFESNPAQNEHTSSIQADQEIAHARYDDDQPLESNPAQNICSSQAVAGDNAFQNTKKHSMYVNEENFPHPAIHKTNETANTTMLITDLIRPARKRAVADSDIESSNLAVTQSLHLSSSRRSSKRSDSELKSRSNSVRMSRSTRYSSYSQSSASSYSSDSGSYSSRPGSYDDKSVSYYTSDGW